MEILIPLLIFVVILGLLLYLVALLPIGQPWVNIIRVLIVIIAIVWLVNKFGWGFD